jgi:RimJ/RimL family protein N-acetyltransferase
VRTIQAHTLPEQNASTRVLEKCGFTFTGEIIHPADGPVWRWERSSTGILPVA